MSDQHTTKCHRKDQTGVVKFFKRLEGWGIITLQNDKEAFVHYTGIVGEGRRNLESGARVRFDWHIRQDGPKKGQYVAKNVYVLHTEPSVELAEEVVA